MIVMEYGSLKFAEKNSGGRYSLPIAPLSDKDWDTAVRGVNKYEECARRYLGKEENKGLWLGDEYLVYGTEGLLENGDGYSGVRHRRQIPSGWMKATLSDRGDETIGWQRSSFDVVWKDAMHSCAYNDFWHIWRSELRHTVFRRLIPDHVRTFRISMHGDIEEGNPEEDGFFWNDLLCESRELWGEDFFFPGPGCIFYHRDDPSEWYHAGNELDTDLSWGLGLDIEDYVELLFETALS
ncbi:hypothetical protein H7347_01395 [Corynebacterium sp. zg-331]|uniref:hypothetical protein n=1 Tax=unclassified Corynebacterium TaxID=2624378 RepID=UPI00128CB22B|nr:MULTISPECIES: hypothetical protein [unclassified Corynebacterium]MBC3185242.1 hypothetical protein [Corynebacterium sp. zg-331]MPV51740.1 hypothetical protein [Corynebacterium sp. zg331]